MSSNDCTGTTWVLSVLHWLYHFLNTIPDSKVHGVNMGPNWVLSAPDGSHVGPMNLAIRDLMCDFVCFPFVQCRLDNAYLLVKEAPGYNFITVFNISSWAHYKRLFSILLLAQFRLWIVCDAFVYKDIDLQLHFISFFIIEAVHVVEVQLQGRPDHVFA